MSQEDTKEINQKDVEHERDDAIMKAIGGLSNVDDQRKQSKPSRSHEAAHM